jgi:hypothetical protein
MGSWLIIFAPIPLALGIAGDLYVATAKASESAFIGTTLALIVSAILAVLWYGYPLFSGHATKDAECARQVIGYKLRLQPQCRNALRPTVLLLCALGAAPSWHLSAVVQVIL